jgi:predicted nucleic acid-binding protein
MTRVLLDTNILLDVLLLREPWIRQASAIWQANDDGKIVCYVNASTITDVYYIARRAAGSDAAQEAVDPCLKSFEICTVDRKALEQALQLPGNDFEDNLQIVCAATSGLEAIVTRDHSGFQAATIPVLSPDEFLATLN